MSHTLDPLHQFSIPAHTAKITIFGKLFHISYSALSMLATTALMCIWLFATTRKLSADKPSKSQILLEYLFKVSESMLQAAIGRKLNESDYKYAKYLFCLFVFLIISNTMGLIPGTFAPTAQMSVTLMLGLTVTFLSLSISIARHGIKFLKIFIPDGIPLALAPLIFVLELFSYFSRPISLAIRLAANMLAGHVMIEVIAFLTLSAIPAIMVFPFAFLVILNMAEIGIAFLQAYIFATLASAYIGDAYHH